MNENKKHVAIIGAGIIGTCCAYELQSAGFKVTVFDPLGVGQGCSKGNAGHFATEQVFPLAEVSLLWQLPRMLLDSKGPISLSLPYIPKLIPWFVRFLNNMRPQKRKYNTQALRSLNERAIPYFCQMLESIEASEHIIKNGSLLVFEKATREEVTFIAEQYEAQGVRLEVLDQLSCQKVEPNLSDKVKFAIWFKDVAHTREPEVFCKTIGDYVFQHGATLRKEAVTNIQPKGKCITIDTINTSTDFDHIVIANGISAKTLIKQLGYSLPIEAERGYHYQLSHNVSLSMPVASADRKFIISPMEKGLRCGGTVEFSGVNAKPNYHRADMLLNHATQLLKQAPEKLPGEQQQYQWQGSRPSLPDSLPVICQAPRHDNIFMAFGHQHLGLTLGAITGKLIKQLVCEESTDVDTRPFCISRFN